MRLIQYTDYDKEIADKIIALDSTVWLSLCRRHKK